MLSGKYQKTPAGVWRRKNSEPFAYSDGDEVENRLLKQIQNADDVSVASDELQQLIVDWPSEYHLSPLRGNLFSSLRLDRFENILEIGSGCGALTRYLGENCPQSAVLALEGSERRAEITKARCRGLENVEVCKESFANFEPDGRFDCITLIGVVEYSPSYIGGADPILKMIKQAQSLLTSDGVLIIAIENQLGLKYFNGCAEDHSGCPFTGISNSYKPETFRTVGRKQLEKKLIKAGFKSLEFFYPFPDYKLPRMLLREESFQQGLLDVSYFPGLYPSRDYSGNEERLFNEAETWAVLTENELVADMANSFLVLAGGGNFDFSSFSEPWQAKLFSDSSKKRYLTETSFAVKDNDVVVTKKLSFPAASSSIQENPYIRQRLDSEPCIAGIPYSAGFAKQVLQTDSYSHLLNYLRSWVDFLKKHSSSQSIDGESAKLMVTGDFCDCIPSNLMRTANEELCSFAKEWEYPQPLETGFVLFRGMYHELRVNMYSLERSDLFVGDTNTAFAILLKLFNSFDMPLDVEIFEKYTALEVHIQKSRLVYTASIKELQEQISYFFNQPRYVKTSMYRFLCAGGIEHYAHMQNENNHYKDQLSDALEELSQMKSCWSWKLGRVLTFIPRLLRK